jgi:DNA topoisomerase-2
MMQDGDVVEEQTLQESIRLRPENLLANNHVEEREHIVAAPGTMTTMTTETFRCSPLMPHMFLEVLSNAVDNYEKTLLLDLDGGLIRVTVDPTVGMISVYNQGLPFCCDWVETSKVYNPELAVFRLLTSTNYDVEDLNRISSGRNGVGGSSVSLFSTRTLLQIKNGASGVEYTQESLDRMKQVLEPVIQEYPRGAPSSTTLTYWVDFPSVFKCEPSEVPITEYSDPMVRMLAKACMEAAGSSTNGARVEFSPDNGATYVTYHYPTLKDFCRAMFPEQESSSSSSRTSEDQPTSRRSLVAFSELESDVARRGFSTRVVIYDTPFSGKSIGYTNGIPNPRGGSHIEAVSTFLVNTLRGTEWCTQKLGAKTKITAQMLLRHISIVVMCKIPSVLVSFDGQRKEKLVCGKYKPKFTDLDMRDIQTQMEDWEAFDVISRLFSAKLFKNIDGKKTYYIGVKGCSDAKHAGTKESFRCTLNICEGDSTMNSVLKGVDSEFEGVYALGGKVLNTSRQNTYITPGSGTTQDECTAKKVSSKKIANLIKILGLRVGLDYALPENMATLRYHHIRLLTDEDVDGYHIQGLIYNLFRDVFPSLFSKEGFIVVGNTPLIRVEGRPEKFYSVGEYEEWREQNPSLKHKIKYYKGLGSNSDKNITDAFQSMRNREYKKDERAEIYMALAFDGGHEDSRKRWISSYDKTRVAKVIDPLSISGFVNGNLMLFNMDVVARSIPSICDGLKPSQRKILYTALSLPASVEHVSSLGFVGKVMELTHYHHGDASLYQTAAGMVSSFIGLNNYPLLRGEGQFGTIAETKPAAVRYTSLGCAPITKVLLSQNDSVLVEHCYDGTTKIEPKWYIPVVPLFALNGGMGIGVGWSTDYPPHRMDNVVDWIKAYIVNRVKHQPDAVQYPTLVPWYRGYTGTVRLVDKHGESKTSKDYWVTEGKFLYNKVQRVAEVVRFPVGLTCESYSKRLMSRKDKVDFKKTIKKEKLKDGSIAIIPHYILKGIDNPSLTSLGLRSKVCDTNINLLDPEGKVLSFEDMHDAMLYWCAWRWDMYAKRRESQIESINKVLQALSLKAQFVEDVLTGTINISSFRTLAQSEVKGVMDQKGYPISFLELSLSSFTKDKHGKLLGQIEAQKVELKYYNTATVPKMWCDDLQKLSKLD